MSEALSPFSFLKEKPWKNNSNSIWIGSSLRLIRNIDGFLFPGKLEAEKQKQLLTLICNVALHIKELAHPLFFEASNLKPQDKEFLFEHFIYSSNVQAAHANEGFILDDSALNLMLINVHDHLKIERLDVSGNLEEALKDLIKIESALGSHLKWAYSDHFGFLNATPKESGTGFMARLVLHLPALIQTDQLLNFLNEEFSPIVEAISMGGNLDNIPGDLLVIRNHQMLGVSEEEILHALREMGLKLQLLEQSLRSHLDAKNSDHFKNSVSRAVGLAAYSYELDLLEALQIISAFKLGLDLKWISGIDSKELNELFFTVHRGHLLSAYPDMKPDEIARKRAILIHESLKKAILAI